MCKNSLRNIAFMAAGMALFFKLSLAGAAIITFDPLATNGTVGSAVKINIVGQDFVADTTTGAAQGSLGGALDISWNPSILQLTQVGRTFPVLAGDCAFCGYLAGPGAIDNTTGTLTGLSVSNFGGTTQASFNIAELSFTLVGAGSSPISLYVYNPVNDLDYWVDGEGLKVILPTGVDGTITVSGVPLPPALLLFGSSLLGMVSFSRRKAVAA